MDASTVRQLIDAEPRTRPFAYARDHGAELLLAWYLESGASRRELKASPFAKLLEKPRIRELCARRGGPLPRPADLRALPRKPRPDEYQVSFAAWGAEPWGWSRDWHQSSRAGWNLVLQLNFSPKQARLFRNIEAKCPSGDGFNYKGHPVCDDERVTLAWSRLDLDLGRGEALIEELQSDWIQGDLWRQRDLDRDELEDACFGYGGLEDLCPDLDRVEHYVNRVLRSARQTWSEALLSASLEYLRRLGLRRIWYHTNESGRRLKLPDARWLPPRSLYSDLPRRFCFRESPAAPGFLRTAQYSDPYLESVLAPSNAPSWYRLEL